MRSITAAIAAATATAIVVSSSFAIAAIPNSNTKVITGCDLKTSGTLRVIDKQANKTCKTTETELSWNQQGSKGEPGNAGQSGLPGSAGPPGAPAPRPAGVVWVATSGGDYATVSEALAAITDNSSTHRYVIRVAPGTFTEIAPVVLKSYVDIEGSGENSTVITCVCGSATNPISGGSSSVLIAAGSGLVTEVRYLTISNTGGGDYSTGIWSGPFSVASYLHVTAKVNGQIDSVGFYNLYASTKMTNVTAIATGGTGRAYGVYNSSASPVMSEVVASARDSSVNIGIQNDGSAPIMNNVTAVASGPDYNYAILFNRINDVVTMNNVTATATGGVTQNYGIATSYGILNMNNVSASASGPASENYGIFSVITNLTARNSVIVGSTNSVRNLLGATAKIANSILDGPLSGVGSFDGSYGNVTPDFVSVSNP